MGGRGGSHGNATEPTDHLQLKAYDNAMAESFFATLETELIGRSEWATTSEAKAAVFDYIEVFYNRIRRHSSLGNLSPERFEERYRSTAAIAAG